MADLPRVAVTGATGFLGSHCCKLLLDNGYRVRGTTRDLKDDKKVQPIWRISDKAKDNLELVQADLLDFESLKRAFEGCEYVLHTAAPVLEGEAEDPSAISKPIIDGTENVLKACAQAGTVKRIVLTGAWGAVVSHEVPDYNKIYDESCWSDLNKKLSVFDRSKNVAERDAGEFIRNLPVERPMELVVILPTYLMGPIIHGGTGAHQLLVRRLMNKEFPAVPNIALEICDVRDVAKAHLVAMTCAVANGDRYLICSGVLWFEECAKILHKEFGPKGYKIPLMKAPKWALEAAAVFDRSIRHILPRWGKFIKFDNKKMINELGITPTPIEKTVLDMAQSMVDLGIVPQKAAKR